GLGRALKPGAAPPSGPFRVAVADAENASGKPSLDGVGDLVARGLQGDDRLVILDRARLVGVLHASGRATPDRLDRGLATFATRQAGGAAVLVPSVTGDGESLVIGVEAYEPDSGRRLFSIQESAGSEEGVVPAVSRLARRTRSSLFAREAEVRGPEQEVSRAVSSNLQAHERYLAGVRCIERPSDGGESDLARCEKHFQQALAIDPDFPLARFELAHLAYWQGHPPDVLRAILDPVVRQADRLPPREQAMVRAWSAELDGDPDRAQGVLRKASVEMPEDARLAFAFGYLLYREGRMAEAVPQLDRALSLDPGHERAADVLVGCLRALDRQQELLRVADRLAASQPTPGTLAAEAVARASAGDLDGALRVARHAAPTGVGVARDNLEDVLVAAGQWKEAEAMLREDVARFPDRPPDRLVRFLLLRGRVRESRALLDARAAPEDPRLRSLLRAREVHQFLVPAGDLARVRRIVAETAAWSPEAAAYFADSLAYLGATDEAMALVGSHGVRDGTRPLVAALVTWRKDGAAAALPALRGLARSEPAYPWFVSPEAPSWFAAECAVEASPDGAALEDLRRARRFFYPLGQWKTWTQPRGLLLEARLLARLDRSAEARETLSRLEDQLSGADPDLPLLRDVRALRRELGTGGHRITTAPREGGH
ncbi:MAG: tetratricopeptide repeat protein, partial [Anaeromyxobacteraceae bacterium]